MSWLISVPGPTVELFFQEFLLTGFENATLYLPQSLLTRTNVEAAVWNVHTHLLQAKPRDSRNLSSSSGISPVLTRYISVRMHNGSGRSKVIVLSGILPVSVWITRTELTKCYGLFVPATCNSWILSTANTSSHYLIPRSRILLAKSILV